MIKFSNISKSFSEKIILNGLSFEIGKNEKVIFSGKSGIGKSTIFKILLGFEKPDSGNIYFENQLVNEKNIWNIRSKIAYVSQDVDIGIGKVSALFDFTLNLKTNNNKNINNISELLSTFGLNDDFLSKNIEELSGGEKQRIAIINSLILKRDIFLLDEITSSLDTDLKVKIIDYFMKNPNFTVLYISHDKYLTDNIDVKLINLEQ